MRSGKLGFRVTRIWYVAQLVNHINCWLIYNPGEYESPKRALIASARVTSWLRQDSDKQTGMVEDFEDFFKVIP